jgi:hypothetical protein
VRNLVPVFIGHFGVAFGAKRVSPRTSLGVLFIAAQLPDLLWPIFLTLGWEHVAVAPGNTAFTPLDFVSYPISHSLVAVATWSVVAGVGYLLWKRDRRGALIVALLVSSHWLLDFLSHRPDLPLYPGGPLVGLGLWNSVLATVIVEGGIFLAGLAIYLRATRARDGMGNPGLFLLVALLVLIYVGAAVGPPPPNVRAVILSGLASWLFPFWAWWVDTHRVPVTEQVSG